MAPANSSAGGTEAYVTFVESNTPGLYSVQVSGPTPASTGYLGFELISGYNTTTISQNQTLWWLVDSGLGDGSVVLCTHNAPNGLLIGCSPNAYTAPGILPFGINSAGSTAIPAGAQPAAWILS